MKLSRHSLYAIVWHVAVAFVGWASNTFLHVSTEQVIIGIATATAAPLFGYVFFDAKAFSRAAARVSHLSRGRLG